MEHRLRKNIKKFVRESSKYRLRLHANGFIVVDLNRKRRLHIWDTRLPTQASNTTIHDHRYSFKSTVLIGSLLQVEYDVDLNPQGEFDIYVPEVSQEGDAVNLVLQDNMNRCTPVMGKTFAIPAGRTYSMAAMDFHQILFDDFGVSIIEKGLTLKQHRPRILCPVGLLPDNEFNGRSFGSDTRVRTVFDEAVERLTELFI